MDQIAQSIARDLRHQYTVAYTPTKTALDGSYRVIKINLNGKPELAARTRKGYYATPGPAPER